MLCNEEPIDLTEEHARQVLRDHITMLAKRSISAHGAATSLDVLENVLANRDIIRRAVSYVFENDRLEAGEFAAVLPSPSGVGYEIVLHTSLKDDATSIPYVVAYYLATVNYGEAVVDREESELFGAHLLGLDVDAYYSRMCEIADEFQAKQSL